MAVAVPAGVVHGVDPTRASTVTVYWTASEISVDWANTILVEVGVGKVIRLGVVLVGVYATWYSIAGVIPHAHGAAVKDFVSVAPVITF